MRQVRDTFIHFLADNLAGQTVHAVRFDRDNRDSQMHQIGAINVAFLDPKVNIRQESRQGVAIDLLELNENDALDKAELIARLLQSTAYIPKMDYSDPSAPVSTGTCVSWDGEVSFSSVGSERYFHLTTLVTLQYVF